MQADPGKLDAGYTPEISEELFSLIIDLYKSSIKPNLNDLKLQKMIDLIEIAEHYFEKYQSIMMDGDYKRALKCYIIGLFYMYLIIPNSIQFQIKNKNYEMFMILRTLFEKEIHMSNVKSETLNYIGYLNEKSELNQIELIRTKTKRSNTLPISNLHQDLNSLLSKEDHEPMSSDSSSTNSSIVEDLWSPPDLQPNDQLKLVSDNYSSDSLNKFPEAPSHPPPLPPQTEEEEQTPPHQQQQQQQQPFVLHHANTLPLDFQPITNSQFQYQSQDYDIPEDQYLSERANQQRSRRKDSYHSVYVNEDEDIDIPIISSNLLFNGLSSGDTFWLIFDLRKKESFKINHIDYENILNIDPSLLRDVEDYQQLFDLLQGIMSVDDFTKFKNLKNYEKIVIYTDNRNFLSFEFDFMIKFKDLVSANLEILKGGFDSWLKYVSKNHSSDILKFKARKFPIKSQPPSIPPPSPPKISKTAPPYDYEKFLPQYSEVQTNAAPIPKASVPTLPPHHHHLPQHYSRSQQPIPSIPENHQFQQSSYLYPQDAAQVYPHQQYQFTTPSQSYQIPTSSMESPQHLSHRPRTNSVPTLQKSGNPFVRLSVTGLRNMGNTCYINSMVQCLFATTKFKEIFINNKFEEYQNPNFKKTKISYSLSKLFQKMYLNGGCSIVPSGFLKNCVQIKPDLKIPNEQQDTQEFLMFLLDQLHDELSNSNVVVNDYPELMSYDSGLGEDYNKWFEGLIKQGFSPISEIFQGQLKDSLKCMKCGFESSNFSTFYMLSLVIPKVSSLTGRKLKKIQLEDCIKMFTNEEVLTGENAWDCPKCSKKGKAAATNDTSLNSSTLSLSEQPRKHRLHFGNGFKFRNRSSSPSSTKKPSSMSTSKSSSKSIKSLNFVKLPPILIIHLSRFLFYDLSTKDTSIVQYPLVLEIPNGDEVVKYKLFGVVNHYGTLKSGHYTSITNKSLNHDLSNPYWYYFDDEVVKTTDHGDLVKGNNHLSSSDVYVLFYERIN